ncbi:DUF6507 family protein [Gandjariella thermophila]|uniref:Uncharacterized protein n=1 Tax=Gandjariella thermophila TaxID=1931992 RepID=A0A4D4JDF4_9PSEU|nr:DUF6507 family protein [Gandjariella thermophila]GDY33664.1 hypothetical protein GTS_52970 [Gandjariella thermophila]
MTGWNIEPAGVQGVVDRARAQSEEFEAQMKSLDTALQGAASASRSPIVAGALEGLANAERKQIQFVFTRVGACINAAVRATNYYVQGDLRMAAHAQAAAASAPQPAPLLPGSRSPIPPGAMARRAK